jgi:cobalt-zinc-cadmium efflux system membrane fusion protein
MTISKKHIVAIMAIVMAGLTGSALLIFPAKTVAVAKQEHGEDHHESGEEGGEPHLADSVKGKTVALDAEQILAAGIRLETAGPARIQGTLQLPGEIKFNADRTAHVVPRLSGVVDSVPADLGKQVKAGDVLATLSSAALSDMRSELLASQKRLALAATTYERERRLWQDKVSAQQDYLQAETSLAEARIAVQNARQKLAAMGATPESKALGRLELRAPFDSVVVEKHITLGEAIREDAVVFILSDLRSVWAEFLISPRDIPRVRVGEKVRIRSTAFDGEAEGIVSYVGALLGQQTRTATARVTLNNPNGSWRPGLFVTVDVVVDDVETPLAVAAGAVQSIGGEEVVFIEVPGGFMAQPVKLGRGNERYAEVLGGLAAGARYVSENSFILKSELGKSSAEHAH